MQRKDDRNRELFEMLIAGAKIKDVAAKFGISRVRVDQLVKDYRLDLKSLRYAKTQQAISQIAPYLGTMYDIDIAKNFNISRNWVHEVRKKLGTKRFLKPVGCANCKTNPYAKGMCKNCYERSRRRGS